MTLSAFFDLYVKSYLAIHCRSQSDFERVFRLYLAPLAHRDMSTIRRMDVVTLQAELTETVSPHAASKAVILISMLYNKAIEWELLDSRNPAARIRKYKAEPRRRFLQADELPRFLEAVQALRYETTRDYIMMLLFTGQRRRNVCEMRWSEINLNTLTWEIARTKNGSSHTVPLVPEALAILARRRAKYPESEWVFARRDGAGPIWATHTAWASVLKRAGLKDLRIHDLRRSLASWQAITGASLPIIGSTLNHKNPSSTAIYARLNIDPVRAAMETAVTAMTRPVA